MDFGRSFWTAAVPWTSRGHTEAARKISAHSESGGRTWPLSPTKAIAHTSIWAFSTGGLCDGRLRGLHFGRGRARGIVLTHGGHAQSLAPFRVRRTKLAPTPHQGYSPPLDLGIFPRGVVRWGPSGAYFWVRPCPWPSFGTRSPHAKSRPIPSPADEVGPNPPPRL